MSKFMAKNFKESGFGATTEANNLGLSHVQLFKQQTGQILGLCGHWPVKVNECPVFLFH